MARRTALTSENLIALGAEKLATIVLDEAGRNAPFKKLVAAALAGAQGPKAVAAVVDRRLAGLERARGFVEWEKRKTFAADIRGTLTTITDELGAADPSLAADRLVRFLTCSEHVFERIDDSSGHIQTIFHDGADALPDLVARMPDEDRIELVGRLIPLLAADGYGLIDTAVHGTIPLLSEAGLAEIDSKIAIAIGERGPSQGDARRDWERLGRRDRLIRARQAIADVRGDVDTFIALGKERPDGRQDGMAIASRLHTAGRPSEALDWVRRPPSRGIRAISAAALADHAAGTDFLDRERVRLEIRILMALGRKNDAQDLRWRTFEATLDADILRDHVAHLGDFEEFDALERAFGYAAAHTDQHRALGFFLEWPRPDLVAKLVLARRDTWAGQHYGLLVPAAEILEHDHPVAATVLYRALLDDILIRARSPAYGHAARYLAKLGDLDTMDLAAEGMTGHEAYRAGLRRSHGRKTGFWTLVESSADGQRRGKHGH